MEMEPMLTGCYLLVVLSEPLCEDHKEKMVQRIAKGLMSWNTIKTECDLKEIETVIENIGKSGGHLSPEFILQHSSERLAVEVLLNPSVSTVRQCVKNMLSSPTVHKHIIHGGYSFMGSGSWMLDDGLFSYDDFVEVICDDNIQNFLKSYSEAMFSLHIHCSAVGNWVTTDLNAQSFAQHIKIELNPTDSPSGVKGAASLLDFLDESLKHQNLDSKMTSTEFIGNIRFNRPTIYIFPSGQGDCSLFGVSGFTMLIDGGFTPVPSFWNFIRHLERLDAIMVTRLNEDNLWGVSSLFKKKILNPMYPQIGYLFCNIAEGVKESDKKQNGSNELLISVIGIGQELLGNIKQIGLSPLQCLREPLSSIEPMTLYHKVGMGTLQMYILSPPRDNKILKEFFNHWSNGKESFSLVRTGSASASHKRPDVAIPLSNLMSICCLLVWKPYDPNQAITRILFPGSAPQSRIFEGLNKLDKLDVLGLYECNQTTLNASSAHKESKDVKSNKFNRFRSVSPSMRSRPLNKQQLIETEKTRKYEDKTEVISNSAKQRTARQVPQKKSDSGVKSEQTSRKSAPTQKRSISQSPKKKMSKTATKPVVDKRNGDKSKISPDKNYDKNYDTDEEVLKITLSMNGVEDMNRLNETKAEPKDQTSVEFQNKLLTSEYLKDDMEPDSLESVFTDGKISKDSLEVSEDESAVDRMSVHKLIVTPEVTQEVNTNIDDISGRKESIDKLAEETPEISHLQSSLLQEESDLISRESESGLGDSNIELTADKRDDSQDSIRQRHEAEAGADANQAEQDFGGDSTDKSDDTIEEYKASELGFSDELKLTEMEDKSIEEMKSIEMDNKLIETKESKEFEIYDNFKQLSQKETEFKESKEKGIDLNENKEDIKQLESQTTSETTSQTFSNVKSKDENITKPNHKVVQQLDANVESRPELKTDSTIASKTHISDQEIEKNCEKPIDKTVSKVETKSVTTHQIGADIKDTKPEKIESVETKIGENESLKKLPKENKNKDSDNKSIEANKSEDTEIKGSVDNEMSDIAIKSEDKELKEIDFKSRESRPEEYEESKESLAPKPSDVIKRTENMNKISESLSKNDKQPVIEAGIQATHLVDRSMGSEQLKEPIQVSTINKESKNITEIKGDKDFSVSKSTAFTDLRTDTTVQKEMTQSGETIADIFRQTSATTLQTEPDLMASQIELDSKEIKSEESKSKEVKEFDSNKSLSVELEESKTQAIKQNKETDPKTQTVTESENVLQFIENIKLDSNPMKSEESKSLAIIESRETEAKTSVVMDIKNKSDVKQSKESEESVSDTKESKRSDPISKESEESKQFTIESQISETMETKESDFKSRESISEEYKESKESLTSKPSDAIKSAENADKISDFVSKNDKQPIIEAEIQATHLEESLPTTKESEPKDQTDVEFKNKLSTSEYLEDDMKPDSLESVFTDGKISKDSLEVSEDKSAVDRMSAQNVMTQSDEAIEDIFRQTSATTLQTEPDMKLKDDKELKECPKQSETDKDVNKLKDNKDLKDLEHKEIESNQSKASQVEDTKQTKASDIRSGLERKDSKDLKDSLYESMISRETKNIEIKTEFKGIEESKSKTVQEFDSNKSLSVEMEDSKSKDIKQNKETDPKTQTATESKNDLQFIENTELGSKTVKSEESKSKEVQEFDSNKSLSMEMEDSKSLTMSESPETESKTSVVMDITNKSDVKQSKESEESVSDTKESKRSDPISKESEESKQFKIESQISQTMETKESDSKSKESISEESKESLASKPSDAIKITENIDKICDSVSKESEEPKQFTIESQISQTMETKEEKDKTSNESLSKTLIAEQVMSEVESVFTDGKISKDSLEVSEDKSADDRMSVQKELKDVEHKEIESNQSKASQKEDTKQTKASDIRSGLERKDSKDLKDSLYESMISRDTKNIEIKTEFKGIEESKSKTVQEFDSNKSLSVELEESKKQGIKQNKETDPKTKTVTESEDVLQFIENKELDSKTIKSEESKSLAIIESREIESKISVVMDIKNKSDVKQSKESEESVSNTKESKRSDSISKESEESKQFKIESQISETMETKESDVKSRESISEEYKESKESLASKPSDAIKITENADKISDSVSKNNKQPVIEAAIQATHLVDRTMGSEQLKEPIEVSTINKESKNFSEIKGDKDFSVSKSTAFTDLRTDKTVQKEMTQSGETIADIFRQTSATTLQTEPDMRLKDDKELKECPKQSETDIDVNKLKDNNELKDVEHKEIESNQSKASQIVDSKPTKVDESMISRDTKNVEIKTEFKGIEELYAKEVKELDSKKSLSVEMEESKSKDIIQNKETDPKTQTVTESENVLQFIENRELDSKTIKSEELESNSLANIESRETETKTSVVMDITNKSDVKQSKESEESVSNTKESKRSDLISKESEESKQFKIESQISQTMETKEEKDKTSAESLSKTSIAKQVMSEVEPKVVPTLPTTHVRRSSQMIGQPLYEDSDEEEPKANLTTEQTIMSTTLSADYPELVSISGGTTPSPSAPQSPHDSKSLSRSESIRSREKITIIDTILEDKYSDSHSFESSEHELTSKSKVGSNGDKPGEEHLAQATRLIDPNTSTKPQEPHQSTELGRRESLKESGQQGYVIIEATPGRVGDDNIDIDQWGRPLHLPTPPEPSKQSSVKSNSAGAAKAGQTKKRTTSGQSGSAVYVELAYVPHHADQHYCNADYFKRIRAKYYVFSGIDPHREVFEALIEGKQVWEKQFTTVVIPTHESESLGFWINNNRHLLSQYNIEVAPAADRCSVNLQGYETKCSAYRVEF